MTIDPAIKMAVGLSLALLLAASAAHKTSSPRAFLEVVRNYKIAPAAVAPPLAFILIAMEMMLAIGLLAPAAQSAAGIGAACLFAFYAIAIAINLARGRVAIDCGCSFGKSADRLSPALLYRNGALIAAALIMTAPVSSRVLGLFDFVSIGLFCATVAALYLANESVRTNAVRFHAMERLR